MSWIYCLLADRHIVVVSCPTYYFGDPEIESRSRKLLLAYQEGLLSLELMS
jgi:hypothetical protein